MEATGLTKPVEGVDVPEAKKIPGTNIDDAQPWQVGFVGQSGKLEEANTKAPAVDAVYKACLDNHREALEKARKKQKFLGIF